MLTETQKKIIDLMRYEPVRIAHWLGFNRLNELNNEWMREFINSEEDITIQAHRGSYKSTCLEFSTAIIMVLRPNKTIGLFRKTDTDVQEMIAKVKSILLSDVMQYLVYQLYEKKLVFVDDNKTQLTTNLQSGTNKGVQLFGMGINGSLTGKHFDIVITDDIVNKKDRFSEAERENTRQVVYELQNIKNRDGRFINTGTPWHKDDAFSIMATPKKYDCYSTGLISQQDIDKLKNTLPASLFACNYELKHIADENALFKTNAKFFSDITLLKDGIGHIDCAYGGEDSTALTIGKKIGDKYYIVGFKRDTHIDNCINEFLQLSKKYICGNIFMEDNGDKGYVSQKLNKLGQRSSTYHESQNKFDKISTFLKMSWENVYFYDDTDAEYIQQIMDYNEQAKHDDCPDSASCLIRQLDHRLIIC